MTWDPARPHNALPMLPPSAEYETKQVLRDVIEARAQLAALDQAARRMPNPLVLINSLSLLEAQASSEIENIVTTTDDLFRFAQDPSDSASPPVKETLRYRDALFAGLESVRRRPLSVTTAVEVCTKIHQREMNIRRLPGTFIGSSGAQVPIYTPPSGEPVIREKLSNWAHYIHEPTDVDPIVVMAVAHYQFEAIHPFEDGNGRTGRILNVLQLIQTGLLRDPVLYISRFIIRNKDDYYRLLLGVTRDGNWEAWIRFMVHAIRDTAAETLQKIDSIQALQARMKDAIRERSKAGSNSDLLDVLFENPYVRIADVIRRCVVSRPTATSWLNALVEAGELIDIKTGRDRLFVNAKLISVLTENTFPRSQEETLF